MNLASAQLAYDSAAPASSRRPAHAERLYQVGASDDYVSASGDAYLCEDGERTLLASVRGDRLTSHCDDLSLELVAEMRRRAGWQVSR